MMRNTASAQSHDNTLLLQQTIFFKRYIITLKIITLKKFNNGSQTDHASGVAPGNSNNSRKKVTSLHSLSVTTGALVINMLNTLCFDGMMIQRSEIL